MEEEKVTKKLNIPVIIMIVAVVLIAAGAILMVTGNKSMDDNKTEEPAKQEEPKEDEPKRSIPRELTIEEAKAILDEEFNKNHVGEEWFLNNVYSVVSGTNNSFLVTYEEVAVDGTVTTKQTIIFVSDGNTSVELPGWDENTRDLSEYHFGEQTGNTEVEQPMTDEQLDEINVVTNDQLNEQTTE